MSLPIFYIDPSMLTGEQVELDEDTSRHVVQVLRMKEDAPLQLTDGKGNLHTAAVIKAHKKHCTVQITGAQYTPPALKRISIAISLLKNASRFEWFLEKATETGISEIIPLLCSRTEKQHFRYDRMQHILVSAMLQSQQVWLPVLHQPVSFELLLGQEDIIRVPHKFIAHCMESSKGNLADLAQGNMDPKIILIGPEGDFTKEEVDVALRCNFTPVTLGNTRLRTETAGVIAASILRLL